MEEQTPSLDMVNDGVTNGDAPAACDQPVSSASAALSPCAVLPPVSHDASDCPVTQLQLAEHQQVASSELAKQLHQDPPQEQLQAFWSNQLAEIAQTTEFKNHSLPLTRIKKIMKSDEDIKKIAGEAPVFFAKACEMFIQELTLRAWHHTKEDKRRVLQKNDITEALARTEVFDFLVPSDEQKGTSMVMPTTTAVQDDDDDPYANYYWECDCFSGPPSPDSPDLSNVTCDDPRYYTYIHEYYSL